MWCVSHLWDGLLCAQGIVNTWAAKWSGDEHVVLSFYSPELISAHRRSHRYQLMWESAATLISSSFVLYHKAKREFSRLTQAGRLNPAGQCSKNRSF
jgi:hypothetical protein